VAGMGDWSTYDLDLQFDFLDNNSLYSATICKDGINADRYAADYALSNNTQIKHKEKMKIHLAPGGGFLIKLKKQ